MASMPRSTMDHFTHPGHRVTELNAEARYRCGGCGLIGRGRRFRCSEGCDFDLHEYCATRPPSLTLFFLHPHTLTLVRRFPGERFCNVCRDPVQGLCYTCEGCAFDAHPICTQLPATLTHALHLDHPLRLRTASTGQCAVCGGGCTSWRYGCEGCGFDVHLLCVLAPPSSPSSNDRSRGFPMFAPPPQTYGPYNYGHAQWVGVPYFHGPYYQGHGGGGGGGGFGRWMQGLQGQLAIGVASNAIFGLLNQEFSSLF